MAVIKSILKLSNTEAVVKISGLAGDTATIMLPVDLIDSSREALNGTQRVNIAAVVSSGVMGGYVSISRGGVGILDCANKSTQMIDLSGDPFVPDSINNTNDITVTITGQPSQVYLHLKKVSGYKSTDALAGIVADASFNILSWFSSGEPGAWYDPSDLTSLFQESTGVTTMSAVGTVADQPVGLMLDKSKGLALGAELVTNGDFSNGTTGWGTGAGWAVAGGVATIDGSNVAGSYLTQLDNITADVGKSYIVSYSYSVTAGRIRINSTAVGVTALIGAGQTGTFKSIVSGGGTGTFAIQAPDANTIATIDNISVKQIAGNHAFQATPANRPLLSSRVNLLTKTEDFSDGVWLLYQATIDVIKYTAPNGTLTAQKLIPTTASTFHGTNITFTPQIATYTKSIYAKSAGYNWLLIQINHGGVNVSCTFDLATGNIGTYYNIIGIGAATIIPVGNGWYKCSLSVTNTTTATGPVRYWAQPSDTSAYIAGDGTSGIYIWGADLRPTNAGALLPPYQRVNTASDYDAVGFPLYLKANGTSSAMSTNSIDFTATDKMTVVTGVRKLSDASYGMIVELSTEWDGLLNGTFAVSGSSTTRHRFGTKGTTVAYYDASTYVSPISNVLTLLSDIGQSGISTEIIPRINGIVNQTNPTGTSCGTGNFGKYPLYLFARAGGTDKFNGQFYGAIIRGAQSDTNTVAIVEQAMARKTGLTF